MASKKILCPYCFEEFQNTEALYQCESDEMEVRDGEKQYRCQRISTTEYDSYWKGENLQMRYIWPQKSGLFSRLKGPSLDLRRCPQCNYPSRRFVCPHCHNWLPTEMIENGAEIISVIGSPSSGKTNYIVALINRLRKYGCKLDLTVSPTQTYRDGHKNESTQNIYKRLNSELFEDGTVLNKTAVSSIDIPWIFHLEQQHTKKDIYLVFYDTAGEKFNENLRNNVRYLKESSGVIVVLDVLSVRSVKKILQKRGFDAFAGKPAAPFQDIQDALANFEGDMLTKKPFAFVFSKFDAIIDNAEYLDFNADEFMNGDKKLNSEFIKTGVVDMDKINSISEVIEAALGDSWDEADFCHFTRKWTSRKNAQLPAGKQDPNDPDNNYKYFGVSALGGMPNEMDQLESVEPYRVMDPLVWILHKLGKFDIPLKK